MPESNAQNEDELIALAAETLTGDIRDFLLDRVKTMGKPWAAMTEDEQSDQIHAARDAADQLVHQVVKLVASQGRKAMVGDLDSVTIKDGIKAVVTLSKSAEGRHELMDSQGQTVLLVVADAEPFTGERAPAEPIPSQSSLLDAAEALKAGDDKVTPIA